MSRLVVATRNPGKLRELEGVLRGEGIEVWGLDRFAEISPAAETGATFEDNARLKALHVSRAVPWTVLADDSGLEVDALGGEPGVHSARYGGEGLDDRARCERLLRALRGVPPGCRTARFRCVLAVAREGALLATFEGTAEGRIFEEPRGSGGFGYDPVFFHEEAGCTFAQLAPEEKARYSHRGQALRRLLEALRSGALRVG